MNQLFNTVTVLDGGLATLLTSNGHVFDTDPLWSTRVLVDHPDAVLQAHKQFLNAGAKIIETCSYQGYVLSIQKHLNLSYEKSVDVVRLSVHIAKEAINQYQTDTKSNEKILVAGSIGSYGGTLCDGSEFTGKYIETTPEKAIYDYYLVQAKILAESGADLLAFETVPSLKEAQIIAQVVQELPSIPLWISFACKDESKTCYGDKFSDTVSALCLNPRVSALGINCTHPKYVTSLLKSAQFGLKPFVVYPNSGEDWTRGRGYYGRNHQSLADEVSEWVNLGAKVVGGCCRIGPNEIAEMASAVKNLSNPVSSLNHLKIS